jgi:hypothetical protein
MWHKSRYSPNIGIRWWEPLQMYTCTNNIYVSRVAQSYDLTLIMQQLGKAALRVTKNYTKGYSETQAKVRDATSNDAWGPSGTQMNEIAQLTYNQSAFCSASP